MGKGTARQLAIGPAGTGDGTNHTAYTCPAGKRAYVTHIHFCNTGTVAQNVGCSFDNGVASASIASNLPILPSDPGEDFFSTPGYMLIAGQKIDVLMGNTISFLIEGYEEDVS